MRHQIWNNHNRNALNQFRHELFHAFNQQIVQNEHSVAAKTNWTPAVDIKELDTTFVIHVDIPGVDPKDIDINMVDSVLTISGERAAIELDQKVSNKRVERDIGQFKRQFNLPDAADAQNITAKSAHGVLELTIAKTEKVKPRRITIDS